jgi:hypothetical protein
VYTQEEQEALIRDADEAAKEYQKTHAGWM